MTTNYFTQLLIDQLESLENLNSRFTDLKCINIDGLNRKGVCSVVFKAMDTLEQEPVAIKFLDPGIMHDKYYPTAFNREPVLLEKVKNKPRCLTLIKALDTYTFKETLDNGQPLEFKIPYFVTEWIEEDIECFFYEQHKQAVIDKLEIYRLTLLAIESMHDCDIHHRDLKADNLKRKITPEQDDVVAIDYGTAAHIEMNRIFSIYEQGFTPGCFAYSGPECELGLSGHRKLAEKTDIYALGCLLYELFNTNLLYYDILRQTQIPLVKAAMMGEFSTCKDHDEIIKKWDTTFERFKDSCEVPEIDGPGSTLPSSITPIVSKLYKSMVMFDFNVRLDNLEIAREIIDTSLLILRNHEEDKNLQLERSRRKRQKQLKAEKRQNKLEEYLKQKKLLSC